MTQQEEPWYKEGLNFKCTGCGKCCTGGPGFVWINEEELGAICAFLGLPREEVTRKYIRQTRGKLALIEKQSYDCIFLKDKQCMIYGARPTQCRTYPFWPEHVRTPESWENLKKECEGINPQADKVSFEEIENQRLIQITRNKNP